jgi:hypothetical protein
MGLGRAPHRDLLGQLAVSPPAEQHQRNVEQQRADQDRVRRLAMPQHCADSFWQDTAAGAHEHKDRGDGYSHGHDVTPSTFQRLLRSGHCYPSAELSR